MAKYTIKIKKYSDNIEELIANAAITPGMLVELMSTGKVRAHAGEGQNQLPMFALEDELQGDGIDDAYAAADPVQCWNPYRGDIVNAILADGESVTKGGFLVSNGDGYLKAYVAETESSNEQSIIEYSQQIVGIALETLDLSSSSAVESSGLQGTQRIQVKIL